eukprot:g13995.t1
MKCAVGLAIGTDGIEVTLLSYLVPCVAAEWNLSSLQQGSLTASVFAGELLGAIILGVMSDAYGRRPAFQVATLLVVLFGLLTTFATGFWSLVIFRSLVGVGAGGMEVPFDLLGEIVTHQEKNRLEMGHATDEEQSSDDEAPEEVSTAAATALAGRRRKAELQARQAAAAPKRKRARTSSSAKGAARSTGESAAPEAGGVEGGGVGADDDDGGGGGLELPSDLLLRVKSGGLRRMEADVSEAKEMEEQAAAAVAASGRRTGGIVKAGDVPRSDNFRLVVLDKDEGVDVGDRGQAGGKAHAAESAKNFLRDRMSSRKRVSHSLFKARRRLGPSPNF